MTILNLSVALHIVPLVDMLVGISPELATVVDMTAYVCHIEEITTRPQKAAIYV